MSKLVVSIEPRGYYEFDVSDMIDPKSEYVAHLLVEGYGGIPVPDCEDIELLVYQSHGHDIADTEELRELIEEGEIDVPVDIDEWVEQAIKWYNKQGFSAERIGLAFVSALV